MITPNVSHWPPRVKMRGRRWGLAAAAASFVFAAPLGAQSLHGAPGTIERQNAAAEAHDFTFLVTPAQVYKFVDAGYLISVPGNADYRVKRIGFPYARPEVEMFVRRLGKQYRAACGERLVVTSLTRPTTRQPRNASSRSVHPTGMAVDLRRSGKDSCRQWLESVLLLLEGQGVIEAVREKRPPHYHVAVFPKPYRAYVDSLVAFGGDGGGGDGLTPGRVARYKVRRGDTLWRIARLHDTTIQRIRAENHLRDSRIYPGQVLALPESRASY
ncbi:MAG: DUF5715 family protein [Gemmatimonadota bacterium]